MEATWWFIKDFFHSSIVLHDFFSKCSSRFLSKELKYSSSCIPKCNSFYLIFWGGVMSLLTISFMFQLFIWCQEWGILNPLISSLELSCVIFHLKPSLRNVANCGAYQWSEFSPILSAKEVFISSLISNKQLFFISGRISPLSLGMFSISPLQAYSFCCWFSSNSIQSFFLKMLSQIHLR